ncbi:hypothetical protein QJQ45_023725, partial [Haematococcus lacustris]
MRVDENEGVARYPASMAGLDDPPSRYLIKRIRFLGRQEVPVFCQNLEGPCPLLAVANVLSLRNQLDVPASATSLSTDRLISLVAERLLDSNLGFTPAGTPRGQQSSVYEANLRANIAGVMEVLGRLHTGIDVNLRFDSPTGFEATPEVAVFDLLDITLLHGWLCDPQDEVTHQVLRSRSYNELVELLVSALEESPPPSLPRQTSAVRRPTPLASPQPSFSAVSTGASSSLPTPPTPASAATAPDPNVTGSAAAATGPDPMPVTAAGSAAAGGLPAAPDPVTATTASGGGAAGASTGGLIGALASATSGTLTDLLGVDELVEGSGPPAGSGRAPVAAAAAAGGQEGTAAQGAGADPGTLAPGAVHAVAGMHGGAVASAAVGEDEGPQPASSGSEELPSELPKQQHSQEVSGQGSSDGVGAPPPSLAPVASPAPLADVFSNMIVADHSPCASDLMAHAQSHPLPPPGHSLAPQPPSTPLGQEVAGPPGHGSLDQQQDQQGQGQGQGQEQRQQAPPPPPQQQEQSSTPQQQGQQRRRREEALVARDFLTQTATQLTVHGLAALADCLRDNALAVFFRNNHFNCMFKYQGLVYLLVTDQGYLGEQQVVWERLDTVDGDTALCGPDFTPYQAPASPSGSGLQGRQGAPHPGMEVDMDALAALPPGVLDGLSEADAAAIAEAAGLLRPAPTAWSPPPAATQHPGHSGLSSAQADADLAMALQLQEQEEEQERQRHARQQQQQQQQQQQAGQQRQQQGLGSPHRPPQQQQQQGQGQ